MLCQVFTGKPKSRNLRDLIYLNALVSQDCQVGLNFASDTEAELFRNTSVEKINQRFNRQGQLLSFSFRFYMNNFS